MASLHYRSASATERRSAHPSAAPSRVNSVRARDYERPSARDAGTPIYPTAYSEVGDGVHKHSKSENLFSGIEKRREKSTVTTTETLLTRRSPRKETLNPESWKNNVGRRPSAGSPVPERRPKEENTGAHPASRLVPDTYTLF